jgi:hypothetical protein
MKIECGFGLDPEDGRDARMLSKFGDSHIPPPEGGSHQNHSQDLKPEGTKAETPAHG